MDLKPLPSAKSRIFPGECSPSIGPMCHVTMMSENSQAQGSSPMESLLMPLPEASRVRTYPSLAYRPGLEAKGPASGAKSSGLLANYDRASSSWRTSQICLVAQLNGQADGLAEYLETWPRSGMMRSGIASHRPLSVLHTCETGFGLWPTPNKSNGFAPFSTLTMQRKQCGETRPSGAKMGFDLKWEPRCVPYLVGGWINPALSEWLMGFPIGHTALPPVETP